MSTDPANAGESKDTYELTVESQQRYLFHFNGPLTIGKLHNIGHYCKGQDIPATAQVDLTWIERGPFDENRYTLTVTW